MYETTVCSTYFLTDYFPRFLFSSRATTQKYVSELSVVRDCVAECKEKGKSGVRANLCTPGSAGSNMIKSIAGAGCGCRRILCSRCFACIFIVHIVRLSVAIYSAENVTVNRHFFVCVFFRFSHACCRGLGDTHLLLQRERLQSCGRRERSGRRRAGRHRCRRCVGLVIVGRRRRPRDAVCGPGSRLERTDFWRAQTRPKNCTSSGGRLDLARSRIGRPQHSHTHAHKQTDRCTDDDANFYTRAEQTKNTFSRTIARRTSAYQQTIRYRKSSSSIVVLSHIT